MKKNATGPINVSLIWKVLFFLFLFQSIALTLYAYLAKQELDKRLIQEKVSFKETSNSYLKNAIESHAQNIENTIYKVAGIKASNDQQFIDYLKQDWPKISDEWGATGTALYRNNEKIAFKHGQLNLVDIVPHIRSSSLTGWPEHYIICDKNCLINIVIPLEFSANHATLIISTSLFKPLNQFQQMLKLKTSMLMPISSANQADIPLNRLNWLGSTFRMINMEANQKFYEILKVMSKKTSLNKLLLEGNTAQVKDKYYYISAMPTPFDAEKSSYLITLNDISQTRQLDQEFNNKFLLFSVTTMLVMFLVVLIVLWHPIARIKRLREYLPSLAKNGQIRALSTRKHSNIFEDEIDILEDSSNDLAHRLHQLHFTVEDREKSLQKLAMFDSGTGLPNRDHFLTVLQQNISQLKSDNKFIAILFIDLDRFKQINDTLGHDVGDQILNTVGKRLQNSIRTSDLVARLGGDEFTILLNNLTSRYTILKIVKLILSKFEEPANINNRMINIQLSIGITVVSDPAASVTDTIKQADIAMYTAKASKLKRFSFFQNEMESIIKNQFNLLNDFQQALTKGELQLHFQPFYSLQDQHLIGFESLIRWHHSERGLLTPDKFLHVIKDTEYMPILENWVLLEGIKKCRRLNELSHQELILSINLGADKFMSTNLVNTIRELLNSHQVQPQNIYIEILEDTLIADVEAAIERISELQILGVKVSLDDFGVGYSSLNYLRRLPADNIKIDRSFVNEILKSETDQKLLSSLISMLINIGKTVTAEGVENKAQQQWLKLHGCHIGQGYYYDKPLSEDNALKLIKFEGDKLKQPNIVQKIIES